MAHPDNSATLDTRPNQANQQIRELEAKLRQDRQPKPPCQVKARQPKTLKILAIADRAGWCFSRRAEALKQYAPEHFSIDITHYSYSVLSGVPLPFYDVVFVLPPNKTREVRHWMNLTGCQRPLISSWNSGPGREGYELMDLVPFADWIIVNNWASYAQALKRTGGRFNGCHISNGVDVEFFRPIVPMKERPKKVLWISSQLKAEDEDDVKGWRSVASVLEKILKAQGIETDFRVVPADDELNEQGMLDFYNSGSVFLITSKSEGTPNTGLEAAACGCAVVSSRVGNMVEIIRDRESGVLVEPISRPPTPQFLAGVKYALEHRERLGFAARRTMESDLWDWKARCPYFYRLFEAAAIGELQAMNPWSYLDAPGDMRRVD